MFEGPPVSANHIEMTLSSDADRSVVPTVLICGLLTGLGWAINGMIGSAPGGSIPGAFIGMAVAGILGFARGDGQDGSSGALGFVRIAAFGAIGFWFGGEMTYGQMFSLTHVNIAGGSHYWWGILGTTVKGAAWQGTGAACIGLGLMHRRYRWWEVALLMAVMTGAFVLGVALLNRPLDSPDDLPLIRFSYDPEHPERPGRTEHWAGIWAGMVILLAYVRAVKNDRVTFRFGLFGMLGGGVGFSAGQMLQALSWSHPEVALPPWVDWWKVMEFTFGFVGGIAIAAAALMTRRDELVAERPKHASGSPAGWHGQASRGTSEVCPCEAPLSCKHGQDPTLTGRALPMPLVEWTCIIIWLLLLGAYLARVPIASFLAALPFVPGIVVLSGLTFARWLPWVVVGVQVPLSTSVITATEILRAYPEDTGWTTNDGQIVSFITVLAHAWPMVAICILGCTVPIWIWLYGRSRRANASVRIFRLFVSYHLFTVIVQMVWRTIHDAASWAWADLASCCQPFWVLAGVFVLCWAVTMIWLPVQKPGESV